MSFFVNSLVTADKVKYEFLARPNLSNQITVLVGPNASGKSRILSNLVNELNARLGRNGSALYMEKQYSSVDGNSLKAPSRIIAQTFSPFSRFPAEKRRTRETIDEFLNAPRPPYVAIGATKDVQFRSSPSRETVERILHCLALNEGRASHLKAALSSLGFSASITLSFAEEPILSGAMAKNATVQQAVTSLVSRLFEKPGNSNSQLARLSRELGSATDLTKLLLQSLALLEQLKTPQPPKPALQFPREYRLTLDFTKVDARESVQALLTLLRLKLIRSMECEIAGNAKRPSFDLMKASSGQQQLTCSILSLAAEAENDSLIVIDEPELSLHPAWQSEFIDFVDGTLSGFQGCHVFIATHSPLIAQRARAKDFEITSIGKAESKGFTRENANASVDQMLLDVFGVPVRDSMYSARLVLSLLMRAEKDPTQLIAVETALKELQSLYLNAQIKDQHLLALIDDALEAISVEDESFNND